MRTGLVPILEGDHQHDLKSKRTVMKTDEFEFLKQSIALRAEALKLEFLSFLNDLERLASEAESLGYRIGREGMSAPAILSNDSAVGGFADYAHEQGFETFLSVQYEVEQCSQKAWDALSVKNKNITSSSFILSVRKALGRTVVFYRLLMDRYLHIWLRILARTVEWEVQSC